MVSLGIARRRSTQIGLSAVVLTAMIGLSACSNPLQDVLEGVVAGQQQKQDEVEVVEAGSGDDSTSTKTSDEFITRELPANFPQRIPVPDLPLFNSVHTTVDGIEGWALQYTGSFDPAIVDEISADFQNSGFNEDETGGITGVMKMAMLSDDEYNVTVSLMGTGNDQILQIIIATSES